MADVTSETKKKVADAYAAFERSLRGIAHEHRMTVSELLRQVDESYTQKLKDRIEHVQEQP